MILGEISFGTRFAIQANATNLKRAEISIYYPRTGEICIKVKFSRDSKCAENVTEIAVAQYILADVLT